MTIHPEFHPLSKECLPFCPFPSCQAFVTSCPASTRGLGCSCGSTGAELCPQGHRKQGNSSGQGHSRAKREFGFKTEQEDHSSRKTERSLLFLLIYSSVTSALSAFRGHLHHFFHPSLQPGQVKAPCSQPTPATFKSNHWPGAGLCGK